MTWLYMLGEAVLFGATIYQMIVIVPAFSYDLPRSMVEFSAGPVKTPAFWTSPIGPLTALFGVLALVGTRRTDAFRVLLISIGFAVAAEVVTVIWVLPMLREMGITAGSVKPIASDTLTAVTRRWVLVDQIRCALLVTPSMIAALVALCRVERSNEGR